MLGFLARFWWVALLVGGGLVAFLFRDFISGNWADLEVGDCFDVPAGVIVEDLQHHPCNESHTGEVFFVGAYPAASGAAEASDEAIQAFVEDRCLPAFGTYTGTAFEAAADFDIGWIYPDTEAWNDGARDVICYVYRFDEAPMTQSVKVGDG
jgi:hypothetical protein